MKEKIRKIIAMVLVICLAVPWQNLSASNVFESLGSGIAKAVSGTYGYLGGILVQKTDAVGNRIIFDRGQFRAVVDAKGNILSLAVYGTDGIQNLNDLKNLVGAVTGLSGDALTNLFKSLDDDGNEIAAQNLKWLNEALKWLNSGANYSITISWAEGGPAVTFAKDGKEMYAKNHMGEVVANYVYDKDGSLLYVENVGWTPTQEGVPGAVAKWQDTVISEQDYNNMSEQQRKNYRRVVKENGEVVIQVRQFFRKVVTRTEYVNGRASAVYEINNKGEKILVGRYEYNNAGQLLSYTDYKENKKILYSGGKPYAAIHLGGNLEKPLADPTEAFELEVPSSEALDSSGNVKDGYAKVDNKYYKLKSGYKYNRDTGNVYKVGERIEYGTVVTVWNYHANGALDTVEGRDATGAWTTTVFDGGRAVAIFDGRKGGMGDMLRKYVQDLISLAVTAATTTGSTKENAENQLAQMLATNVYGLKQIYLYNDQVQAWHSKYGLDKAAAIIIKIYGWTDETYAFSLNTARTMVEHTVKYGYNGSHIAMVASYTNTLNQNDNANSSYVFNVTLYAAGRAVLDINTSYLDQSYVEMLREMFGITDFQNLTDAEIENMVKSLYIQVLVDLIVQQYQKKLEEGGLTDEERQQLNDLRARLMSHLESKGFAALSNGNEVDNLINELLGIAAQIVTKDGQSVTLDDNAKKNIKDQAKAERTRIFGEWANGQLVNGGGGLLKMFKDLKNMVQSNNNGQGLSGIQNLSHMAQVVRSVTTFLANLLTYVNYQIQLIQNILNAMPALSATQFWTTVLGASNDAINKRELVDKLKIIIREKAGQFGGQEKAQELIRKLDECIKSDGTVDMDKLKTLLTTDEYLSNIGLLYNLTKDDSRFISFWSKVQQLGQGEFGSGWNSWYIAFNWWDSFLGSGTAEQKRKKAEEVINILIKIIQFCPEEFGSNSSGLLSKLNEFKSRLASGEDINTILNGGTVNGIQKEGLLSWLNTNLRQQWGNNIFDRVRRAVERRLNTLVGFLNKVFKFNITINLNLQNTANQNGNTWNFWALNNAFKTAMTNILRNLKDQVTGRITAMMNCFSRGDVNGLKNLNSNINISETQNYTHDPSIAGTLLNIVYIDGKYYAVVSADYIDLMDGLGAQDAEGETIYVEISDELAAQLQDKIGGSVMFMGDVAADVNGHLTITMNVAYGGGYRDLGKMSKAEMKVAMDNLKNEAWYTKVLNDMKAVWANVIAQYGNYSNWRQGFQFLRDYATGGSVAFF